MTDEQMSIIDEMAAALKALEQAPANVLVAYLVNDRGYANLKRLAESRFSLKPITVNPGEQMHSSFSGVPIHRIPGLAYSVCLFADGSTKPMLT